MRVLAIAILVALGSLSQAQGVYICKDGFINFFSSAPLEDITADNNKVSSVLNTKDGKIVFKVPIKSFTFEKSLMQEHFNEEKYMWSEKHPYAQFSGNITNLGDVDFGKAGSYPVKINGELTIRGVKQPREIDGTLVVAADGAIEGNAKFKVKLEEHEVPIPSVVIENIAEVVDVTVKMQYSAHSK